MSFAEAQSLAREQQWLRAITVAREAVAKNPGNKMIWRNMASWAGKADDIELLRRVLDDWAQADSGAGGYEALSRLTDLDGPGDSVASRARSLIRRAKLNLWARRLVRPQTPVLDRLLFAILKKDLTRAVAALRELSRPQRFKLPPFVLMQLQDLYAREGKGAAFLNDVADGELASLEGRNALLAPLAHALAKEEHIEEAERVLAMINGDSPRLRLQLAAELLIAEHHQDDERKIQVLSRWIARFPNDRTPVQALAESKVAAGACEELVSWLEETECAGLAAPACLRLADMMAERGALRPAFALVSMAAERWPENRRVAEKIGAIADLMGQQELAREARARSLILDDLEPDFIELAGYEGIVGLGGRSGLHHAVLAALGDDGDTRGLLDLARLLMGSLRIVISIRSGDLREAKELAPHGAADWSSRRENAQRLATLIRAICALAIRSQPEDDAAYWLLLELEALTLDGGALAEHLATALAATPVATEPAKKDLVWTAALACDREALWDDLAQKQLEGSARPMRFAALHPDFDSRAVLRHAGSRATKTIGVFGPRFHGRVDLGLPTRDEYLLTNADATILAGYLVSPDGRTVLGLSHNHYTPRSSDRVLQAGVHGVVVDLPEDTQVIETPTVYIPGLRAHYRNYYHFGGQLLPRLMGVLAEAEAAMNARLAVAIPDFAPQFVDNMLELCGIESDRIIRLATNRRVRLVNGVIASPTLHDWQCQPDDISAARQRLRGALASNGPGRKLFLARPTQSVTSIGRALLNEAELSGVAADMGYEIVDAGVMTQAQQQQLFSEAAVICGPTGAALTNALYLPDGARVICLSPHETCRTYFPGLTLGQQIDFDWVLGSFDPDLVDSRWFPHRPYSVPVDYLAEALSK
ncbi:glycosyltransferase 61 family protein [Paracoccus jiaweipingae]|uniref:glycosyltransferase 61 family protein n=1 Tax=unclassified Paracoccus (in: a-proteobacteria) TaxID=2688777 RepID=UPI00378FB4D7